jgi:AraC-like DNA-binding protein
MRNQRLPESDAAERLVAAKAEMATLIARHAPVAGNVQTPIEGVMLYRRNAPTAPSSNFYPPSLGFIAQGLKRVSLGGDVHDCDARSYLLTSVDIPTVAQVIEASEDVPYLSLRLTLEPREIAQLSIDFERPHDENGPTASGMAITELPLTMAIALCRLLALLDEPENIDALAPLLKREIMYRLLIGGQGHRLRQMSIAGSHGHQIGKAISWLKQNYTQPLKLDELAARVPMAPSTLHHHFRAITAMSPLQYQKQLRLHEARRLMLTDRIDAASAAFRVGYESPSQFSREYGRLFGAPPLRDISRWREEHTLV